MSTRSRSNNISSAETDQRQSGIRKQLQREKELLKQAMNPRGVKSELIQSPSTGSGGNTQTGESTYHVNFDDLQSMTVNYLQDVDACDVVTNKRKLVAIHDDISIRDAVKVLCKHKLLTLVVVDEKQRFSGVIDMNDVTKFCAKRCEEMKCDYSNSSTDCGSFLDQSVYDMLDHSKRDFALLRCSASAYDCAKVLANGVHRCLILNEEGVVDSMIGQKQMLRFLVDKFANEQRNPLSDVTLNEIGYNVSCRLKTIPSSMQVCKAIRKLPKECLLGVLDQKGELAGTFTTSDCVWAFCEKNLFQCDVLRYLGEHSKTARLQIADTHKDLQFLFSQLCKSKYRHIVLLDEAENPTGITLITYSLFIKGVFTLSDALKILVSQ